MSWEYEHMYSVSSKDPVPFHGFYSEPCSDGFLSLHTSLFEIPWCLILNMLRIELTPIHIILYPPPPPHQVCIFPAVIPYLSVWFCFPFFCVKIITNSQWHTIHTFTSHLWVSLLVGSFCFRLWVKFRSVPWVSGAQTEEVAATWGMFFSRR